MSLELTAEQERLLICAKAIETFGAERQIRKAVEELTELSLALQKDEISERYSGAVDEEMADVEIMLEQIKIIRQNAAEVESWKKSKLHRLEFRINEGYYDKRK